jgi:predicted phosphoribosyltransferase
MSQSATLLKNRRQAGLLLARRLQSWRGKPESLVLALPRGGVPVGYAIAQELGLPLDVLIVRKLGMPQHEELAMGAIASGGHTVLTSDIVSMAQLSENGLARVVARESAELSRREQCYRGARPPLSLRAKHILLVDDGMATGSTMQAAIHAVRAAQPAHIAVAVPVLSHSAFQTIEAIADQLVYLGMPDSFQAVGCYYEDFGQTSDDEVIHLLAQAQAPPAAALQADSSPSDLQGEHRGI